MERMVEVGYLLGFYASLLTDRQQSLLDAYYNQDLSLSEIAQQEGISRQGVYDSIKRGENELYRLESLLGLAGRYRLILSELERIKSEIKHSKPQAALAALDQLIETWED